MAIAYFGIAHRFASASSKKDFPYTQTERPRSLEEGLNYFIPGFPPDIIFLISILWMAKHQPKMLERLAMKYLDVHQHIIVGLAQAGAGNIVSAYAGNFLAGLMLEQNYMIRQKGADDLIASLNWLTGAELAASWFKDFSVPATLVFAGAGGTFPTGTADVISAISRKGEKAPKPITNVPVSKVP